MATTQTTGIIEVRRKGRKFTYKKTLVRMLNAPTVTTGSSSVSDFVETFDKAMMRLSFSGGAGVGAATTGTLTVETGATTVTTDIRTCQSSSGAMSLTFGSTHNSENQRAVFVGLDNYTRVRAVFAGDSAASTGVFCDGEFL